MCAHLLSQTCQRKSARCSAGSTTAEHLIVAVIITVILTNTPSQSNRPWTHLETFTCCSYWPNVSTPAGITGPLGCVNTGRRKKTPAASCRWSQSELPGKKIGSRWGKRHTGEETNKKQTTNPATNINKTEKLTVIPPNQQASLSLLSLCSLPPFYEWLL